MSDYLAITEDALDLILMHQVWDVEGFPRDDKNIGLGVGGIGKGVVGFFTSQESGDPYFALINVKALKALLREGPENTPDIYRKIARVLKGLKSPPIHLPRQWSEYHYRNLLTFFALPKTGAAFRWIADTDGNAKCVRFAAITSRSAQVDLTDFSVDPWPGDFGVLTKELRKSKASSPQNENATRGLAAEIDLHAIGTGSVVKDRTYEDWQHLISVSQKNILSLELSASIRIVGPAGSGKTLALCLRVVQISRDANVRSQGKKILVATHSWAMAERIDGILSILNGGVAPDHVTVFPLQSLLQMHAGHIGQQRTEIIGDDSTDGRIRAIEIIRGIVGTGKLKREGLSSWISEALNSSEGSRARLDLVFNLYEEISGVLSASSLALDDPDSIKTYLNGVREDWMPPFPTVADRGMVLNVYREFIRVLVDRASITTDQFVLDAIRVLETFTWRMRKETDGYDYIFVDELQLFDSQERSALELLGRSRKGVPFITAEDPSQGVFAGLHSKRGGVVDETVYLDTVHRFDKGIFDLINFIYQKFPLNTIPLKIDEGKAGSFDVPKLHLSESAGKGVEEVVTLAGGFFDNISSDARICIATLGDVDSDVCAALESRKIGFTRLASFDDVEKLSYRRRSVIVAPWQYIGGTQFSHVIVAAINLAPAVTAFGKRHELTAIYLACSRATQSLDLVCSNYVPQVIRDAKESGLVVQVE